MCCMISQDSSIGLDTQTDQGGREHDKSRKMIKVPHND